jgi:uncharacterized coiled-coil DUF342 family protein
MRSPNRPPEKGDRLQKQIDAVRKELQHVEQQPDSPNKSREILRLQASLDELNHEMKALRQQMIIQ